MESRVKNLVDKIRFIYLKSKSINNEIDEAIRNGKKGKVQQLRHTEKYLYRKIHAIKEEVNSIIKGSICNIKYEYYNGDAKIISDAILVNVNDKEIEDILKLYCMVNEYKFIGILEIQRIPTKLV